MTSRQEFEAWICKPPIGAFTGRHPKDSPKAISFPGHYNLCGVQLAWEAWQQGRRALMDSIPITEPAPCNQAADRARKRRGS